MSGNIFRFGDNVGFTPFAFRISSLHRATTCSRMPLRQPGPETNDSSVAESWMQHVPRMCPTTQVEVSFSTGHNAHTRYLGLRVCTNAKSLALGAKRSTFSMVGSVFVLGRIEGSSCSETLFLSRRNQHWDEVRELTGLGPNLSSSWFCTHTTASTLPLSSMLIAIWVTMPVHWAPCTGCLFEAYLHQSQDGSVNLRSWTLLMAVQLFPF